MNKIEALRTEMQHTTQEVMDVTGLSQDDISRMIFECAYDWLTLIGCDSYGLEHMPQTKEFWSFWKKEWYDIDRQFLRHYYYWGYTNTREWYRWFHQAGDNHHLNSAVVHAAYHRLVKDLAIKR